MKALTLTHTTARAFVACSLLLLTSIPPIFAQRCNSKKLLEEAESAFRAESYSSAIRLFNEARDCNPKLKNVSSRIAEAVSMMESQYYALEQKRAKAQSAADTCNQNLVACNTQADSLNTALKQQMQLTALMDFKHGRTWIYREGKFAMIDQKGTQLTDFIFENPKPFINSTTTLAVKESAVHVLDLDGKTLKTFDFMLPTNNEWYRVRQKNQHTFLNQSLNPVGRWTWYDAIQDFSMGLAAVKKDGVWGYADVNGYLVIRPQFSAVTPFSKDSIAVIVSDTACGVVNMDGEVLWQMQAEWMSDFKESVAIFKQNGKLGLVNKKGVKLLSAQYDRLTLLEKEATDSLGLVWRATDKDKQQLFNHDGTALTKTAFDSIENFREGMARVMKSKKWGYINRQGRSITPPQYKTATRFSEGFAIVKDGRDWVLLNPRGKTVKKMDFDRVGSEEIGFVDGLMPVECKKRWGYINTRGLFTVPCEFREAAPFSDGKAVVKTDDGRRGVIDISGNLFFSTICDKLRFLEADLVAFEKNSLWGIINLRGKVVSPPQYDAVHQLTSSVLVVEKGRRFGFTTASGQTILEPQFDSVVENFRGEHALVKLHGNSFHINRQGQIIVKSAHDAAIFTRQLEKN